MQRVLLVLSFWILAQGGSLAQSQEPSPTPSEPITVEPSFAAEPVLEQDQPFELRLSRPLKAPDETRVAVLLGNTDVSSMFTADASGALLAYAPAPSGLPKGEQELVVYLCTVERQWIEIGRFPVKVLGRLALRRAQIQPSASLSLNGQVAESHFPEDSAPPRATFQDLTATLGLQADLLRRGLNLLVQAGGFFASNRQQALLFGVEGEDAPKLDLASYTVTLQREQADRQLKASLGHVSLTGGHRHLLGTINSRGLSASATIGQRLSLALGATSGTSLTGADHITGLDEGDNRILTASLGFEALARPGALRLEATGLDAKILASSGFNQGAILDPQRNKALALRLLASDASQRIRVEAGFTRSTFTNPTDPQFESQADPGFSVVPVQSETKNARFLDVNLDLLQSRPIGGDRTASLSVLLRHERVDPLFASVVGATSENRPATDAVTPDRDLEQVDVQALVSNVSLQASLARFEDNLGDIESILKTKTRRASVNLSIPVAQALGQVEAPSPFLPTLSYSLDFTHQFGASTPVNGEFDEASEVPDQASTSHNLASDWSFGRLSLHYALSRSFQDNRAGDRADADFLNATHVVSTSVSPVNSLSLGLEANFEKADNREQAEVNDTKRFTLNSSWSPVSSVSVSAQASRSRTIDDKKTNENKSLQFSAQGTWSLQIRQRLQAQLSLSFNHSDNQSINTAFDLDSRFKNTTLQTGLSLSF